MACPSPPRPPTPPPPPPQTLHLKALKFKEEINLKQQSELTNLKTKLNFSWYPFKWGSHVLPSRTPVSIFLLLKWSKRGWITKQSKPTPPPTPTIRCITNTTTITRNLSLNILVSRFSLHSSCRTMEVQQENTAVCHK